MVNVQIIPPTMRFGRRRASARRDSMHAVFDRLSPAETRPPHEWLAEFDPQPTDDRPFVYLDMVSSVDGRATLDGRAQALGSDTDTLLLTELRALADAVLIGIGTLRAEGYGKLVGAAERVARRRAAGREPTPPAVLLSRSLDLPWDAPLFGAPDQPVLVYTGSAAEPPAVVAPVQVIRLADPTPAAMLADLRARGVGALLCEGGPTLNRALLGAGAVDELFVTLSPLLVGQHDAPRILEGEDLPAPLALELLWTLHHDGELYLRYGIRHD
jgi:riboflavin biosynthesis pyrimidine reductase